MVKMLLAMLFFSAACSGGGSGSGGVGEEFGDCYPNSTCNMGLLCVSDICVKANEGAESGPCYPNQTCDDGLVCLQDVCTRSVADAGPDAEPDAALPVDCSSSSSFNYVLSALTIPQNATEAQNLSLDIDGDNVTENALGGLLGALGSTADLDMQTATDAQVATGSFIQLFGLEAALLTDSSAADVCTFEGASPSIQPCTIPDNLGTCGQHLAGTASFSIAGDGPVATVVTGGIASGDFESPASAASTTTFVALSLMDGTPLVLPLASARIRATTSTAGSLMSGIVGGGLSEANIDTIFLPAFAASIQAQIDTDCTGVGVDCGCVGGSSGESLLSFFDTNDDCDVPTTELLDNALIGATLRNPDLDLLDAAGNPGVDGVADHLSAAFGFSAVSASF